MGVCILDLMSLFQTVFQDGHIYISTKSAWIFLYPYITSNPWHYLILATLMYRSDILSFTFF
jgi:hypothetical protein